MFSIYLQYLNLALLVNIENKGNGYLKFSRFFLIKNEGSACSAQ
jgi:hypothetical protein